RRSVEGAAAHWQEVPERVGDRSRKKGILRGVGRRRIPEKLPRDEIQIPGDRQVITPCRDEVGFDNELSWQFALNAENQPSEFRAAAIDGKDGAVRRANILSDTREQSEARAERVLQSIRERVAERRDKCPSIVIGRHEWR